MTSKSAPPTYTYKIVPYPTPTPESSPTKLPVLSTLNAFFSEEQKLHLLRIPYEKVKQLVKREDSTGLSKDEALKLGADEVDLVGIWEKAEDTWEKASWPFGSVDAPMEL
ncbi:hypothetical protein FRB97_001747 [Tulasnella sp. 331]|nr:hypothetical protein FRB97_001747 [Tulasnella sp. 331]